MGDPTSLRERAAQGDAQARVQFAYQLLIGNGVARSIPEALEQVQAACAQGSANAMMLRAALAARGIGCAKNLDEAYALVRQAATLGHTHAQQQLTILGERELDRAPWSQPIQLIPLAEVPRVFSVDSFIPKSVCDWIIKSASSKLQPCMVFTPDGGSTRDAARTNSVAGFHLIDGDLIQQLVCRRMAIATGLPLVNQERMNVLRYEPGQEYKPHYDFIRPWEPEALGYAAELAEMGQRAVTVLIYLNDDYEGGETVFPRLNLAFKGKAGDALIFWNVSRAGELERDSLHAGAPVTAGEKWVLSQWVRESQHPLI
ncbi:MAG: 2OG-Fe(II) oxygenase [Hyphomonadaceae bacterium JAD_PAG50586_4]|nr:MAG: 2OG-Fe(II) oxygenase [Hyphomonadaceae bacterium JAD_PAG50586_4]